MTTCAESLPLARVLQLYRQGAEGHKEIELSTKAASPNAQSIIMWVAPARVNGVFVCATTVLACIALLVRGVALFAPGRSRTDVYTYCGLRSLPVQATTTTPTTTTCCLLRAMSSNSDVTAFQPDLASASAPAVGVASDVPAAGDTTTTADIPTAVITTDSAVTATDSASDAAATDSAGSDAGPTPSAGLNSTSLPLNSTRNATHHGDGVHHGNSTVALLNTTATGNGNHLAPLVWESIVPVGNVLCAASYFNVSDSCCNASSGRVGLQAVPPQWPDGSNSSGVQHTCLIPAAGKDDAALQAAAARFTNCARYQSNQLAVSCSVSTEPRVNAAARRRAVIAVGVLGWALAAAVAAL